MYKTMVKFPRYSDMQDNRKVISDLEYQEVVRRGEGSNGGRENKDCRFCEKIVILVTCRI